MTAICDSASCHLIGTSPFTLLFSPQSDPWVSAAMQLSYATCPESQPIIHHFLCFSWGVPEMDWPNSSWSEFMRSGMPVQCRLNQWLSSPPLRGKDVVGSGTPELGRRLPLLFPFSETVSNRERGLDGRERDLASPRRCVTGWSRSWKPFRCTIGFPRPLHYCGRWGGIFRVFVS